MSDQLPPSRFGAGHTYGGTDSGGNAPQGAYQPGPYSPGAYPANPYSPDPYSQNPYSQNPFNAAPTQHAPLQQSPPAYGAYGPASTATPPTPRRKTSGATAAFAILLAVLMAVDQGIASYSIWEAVTSIGRLPARSQLDAGLPVGLTVLLGLGALLLLCRASFGRFLLVLGGLGVLTSYASVLLFVYADVGRPLGTSGYGYLVYQQLISSPNADIDMMQNVSTAVVVACAVAGLLIALFAMLPATGRWCRRQ